MKSQINISLVKLENQTFKLMVTDCIENTARFVISYQNKNTRNDCFDHIMEEKVFDLWQNWFNSYQNLTIN